MYAPRALRTRPRPAGPAVAWFGATFLLAQLGGWFLVDACPAEIRLPELESLRARLANGPAPDIVAFGSSRTFGGFVPERVAALVAAATGSPNLTAANAAVAGGDLLTTEKVLLEVLARGKVPRVAVFEVSPETLGRRDPYVNFYILRSLRRGELLSLLPEIALGGRLSTLASSRLIPFFGHRRQLLAWVVRAAPWMEREVGGVVLPPLGPPQQLSETPHVLSQEMLVPLAGSLRGYRADGQAAVALGRILTRCRRRGIRAVLVAVPACRVYRGAYTPAIDAVFRARIEELTRAGGAVFADERAALDDRYFRDGHHLTPEGAAAYSDLLARDVLAPIWKGLRDRR